MEFRELADRLELIAKIVWIATIIVSVCTILLGIYSCDKGKGFYHEEAPEYFFYALFVAVGILINGTLIRCVILGFASLLVNVGLTEKNTREILNALKNKSNATASTPESERYNNNLPTL